MGAKNCVARRQVYYSLFKEGEINWGRGTWKIKSGWKYGVGAALLKRAGRLALLLFNFFRVNHFYL